jgi:hypothetical protein
MPRTSKRHRFLRELNSLFNTRLFNRGFRQLNDEEDSLEDILDAAMASALRNAESRRYLFRKKRYRCGKDRFEEDLEYYSSEDLDSVSEEAGKMSWLTEEEFLQKYRMSRESFSKLVGLIKDHPVFEPKSKGRKQTPVAHQLMVFLRYLGTEGTGATNSGQ